MIFFDLDGTLYKTHETCLPPLQSLCRQHGIPLSAEGESFLICNTADAFLSKYAPKMPEYEKNQFKKTLSDMELLEVEKHGRLFDGVTDMLISLKSDGFSLGICGMGSRKYIDRVLTKCGIKQYFDTVLHRAPGKTKAQVLSEYISQTGLVPEKCVFVGDSLTDYSAAENSGVPFVGVSYGFGLYDIDGKCILADTPGKIPEKIYLAHVFSTIENEIKAKDSPVILGINGIDTSGKTVFSEELAQFLSCRGYSPVVLHLDDFHHPKGIRYQDLSPAGYINYSFDLDKLRDVLTAAKKRQAGREFTLLDLDTDTYSKTLSLTVSDNTIIIVEGVLLYRPPVNSFFDYRIFLDIDKATLLHRAKLRDVPKYGEEFLKKYISRYIPAHEIYMREYHPTETCDLIIDNNDFKKPRIIQHLSSSNAD